MPVAIRRPPRVGPIATAACFAGMMLLGQSHAAGFEPVVEYDWQAVRCLSEFPLEDPQRLCDDLLKLHAELQETLQLKLDDAPIEIRLYAGRRRYLDEVSALTPDARRQRGVYLVREGRACVFSFEQRDLDQTVRHEATHALLHSALPYVPLWLDEGLASYFEGEPHGARLHPYRERLQWSLRLGWRPDLATLEQIRTSPDMDLSDYRQAWGWVCYLLQDSDDSRAVLTEYLAGIAADDPPQPFSKYLEPRMPDAAEQCARYLEELRN